MTTTATAPAVTLTAEHESFLEKVVGAALRNVECSPPALREEAAARLAASYRRDAETFRTMADDDFPGWPAVEWAAMYERVADALDAPRFLYPLGTVVALTLRPAGGGAYYPEGPVTASSVDSVTIAARTANGPREYTATRDSWEDGRAYPLGPIDPHTGLIRED